MSFQVQESTARESGRCLTWACCGVDEPLANYTADHDEQYNFVGQVFGKIPPTLGVPFEALGCMEWCYSTVSQEEADECAALQAVLCVNPDICYNDPYTCTIVCATGGEYSFTVPAGMFYAATCQEANALAKAYCEENILPLTMCILGDFADACYGEYYSDALDIDGAATPTSAFVSAGSIPGGMTVDLVGSTVVLHGTPTDYGDFAFTITVTSSEGVTCTKTVSLCVLRVVTAASEDAILPDGTSGDPYSEQLLNGGCGGSFTWSITGGSLPDGLTMDNTGLISGTPTLAGVFVFEVEVG